MVTNTLSIPISFASLSNNLSSSFPYPFPRNAGAIPYPIFPPAFLSASVKKCLTEPNPTGIPSAYSQKVVEGTFQPSTIPSCSESLCFTISHSLYSSNVNPLALLINPFSSAVCKYLSHHQLTIFLIPTLFSILLNQINSSLSVCLIISYGFNVRQEQSRQTLLPGLMLFYGHLHFVPAFVFIIRALSRRAG